MKTKKLNTLIFTLKIIILSTLLSIAASCEKNSINTDDIYFNSFEKESDLNGWLGYYELRNEAPVQGGHQSLYISGGCVWPHAYYELGPFDEDLELTIQCWGKNLDKGGGINLMPMDSPGGIHLSIDDKNWKKYTTDSLLFCPAGTKLQLSLSSGGLISSAMLVDMIEIIRK